MQIDVQSLPDTPAFEGGEGLIYKWNNQALKIYKPHVDKSMKEKKIKALLLKNLPRGVVAPTDLVYDSRNQFVGFLMPWLICEEFKRLSNRSFVKSNQITLEFIGRTLLSLLETIQVLHQQGIVIGDLNDTNVSFDLQGNVYFLDTDSWAVDQLPCQVCMDSFKDPKLQQHFFTPQTDMYAAAIIVFKSLVRLHPFGGTMNPDISLLDRMSRKQSVLSGSHISIPKNVNSWLVFSPEMISAFKQIFDQDARFWMTDSLKEWYENLLFCTKHQGHYFNKFTSCPSCDSDAKLKTHPTSKTSVSGIPYRMIPAFSSCAHVIDEYHYLNTTDEWVHTLSNRKVSLQTGEQVRFSNDGNIIYKMYMDRIHIETPNHQHAITTAAKTLVYVHDRKAYFVDPNSNLCEFHVDPKGNTTKNITKIANRHFYHVSKHGSFAVFNVYDHMTVIQIDGYFFTLQKVFDFQDIHFFYDAKTKQWLFVGEKTDGSHHFMLYDKTGCLVEHSHIRLNSDLDDMCFDNGILFMPAEEKIRGFHIASHSFKDFLIPCVRSDCKLYRQNNHFICLHEIENFDIG